MELINDNDNFHNIYYNDILEIIKPFVDKQFDTLPKNNLENFTSFRQFLNTFIDPILLLHESLNLVSSLPEELINAIFKDLNQFPFKRMLDYINCINYNQQAVFSIAYNQLIKTHKITEIIAARCIHDCIIHYMRDKFKIIKNIKNLNDESIY